VDQSVNHGSRDDRIAEDLTPGDERLVGRHDHRAPFVARRDQLEEQVGGFGVEGDVAHLEVGPETSPAGSLWDKVCVSGPHWAIRSRGTALSEAL